MLRHTELPSVSDLLAFEEEAVLSDPSPDGLASALASLGVPEEKVDDGGLGFRALLERPEALPDAWPAIDGKRLRRRARA